MVKYLFIIFFIAIAKTAFAYDPGTAYDYITRYKATALQNEKDYGIPATIILAQGILESGAGTSELTRVSNNHFGIKAGPKWKGKVHLVWDDEAQKSKFRCYDSAAQALIGIIDLYKLYEINGGAKLRPGKTVIITRYKTVENPVFEEDCILADEEESEEQTMVAEAVTRFVVLINDIHCTVLQPGETLSSISRKYNISAAQLLKFNEIGSEYQLKEGDIIFLDKKKKKYEGPRDIYVAKDGDTLYRVSQEFGIQLRRLAKLNNMNDYVRLQEGTRIILK